MENKKLKLSPIKLTNVIATSKAKDRGEGSKPSKLSSVLDACIKTNFSDESFDFIECDFGKNRKVQCEKKEHFICEICRFDITDLSVENRAIHVHKCIDEQISSQCEGSPPASSHQDENVTMLGCPFCSRHFSVPEVQSNHIKKCGKTKGLSTQSIIQALELERRYAMERIALGIPAKPPPKPPKSQKNAAPKKVLVEPKSKNQSDLQLAKALSLSLTKEVELKPPAPHQRPGRKNKTGITPLLVLRNDEERRKLLLEKVAAIVEPKDIGNEIPEKEALHSQEHSEDCCKLSELWNLSSQSSEKYRYYVERLLSWIKPSKMEAGAKLAHLSQVAGHEILTQLPCDYTFSSAEDQDGQVTSEICLAMPISSSDSSGVTNSLCSLVASSWMSDVDVRTACGTVIPAHRLILALRCPPLKQDPNFCFGAERSVLQWDDVSFEAALQFLNFVYSGIIELKRDILSNLLFLAKKYEVGDLLPVLQNFQAQDTSCRDEQTSTSWCGQKESSAATIDSDVDDCEDLQIVCEFLNTDLKPSLDSQHSSSTPLNTPRERVASPRKDSGFARSVTESLKDSCLSQKAERTENAIRYPRNSFNVCRSATESLKESCPFTIESGFWAEEAEGTENSGDAIRYPRNGFNVCRSATENAKESCPSTEETGFRAGEAEGAEILEDTIRYPRKSADMRNTEGYARNKLSDSSRVHCYPHPSPKSEDKEINVGKEESFKSSDSNSGNLNQIQENQLKQDDSLHGDSFKFSSPCSVFLGNSNRFLKTTYEAMDVDHRDRAVSDVLLSSNALSSGNLPRDPNASFYERCTENIVCDNALCTLSSNLHKTNPDSSAKSFEDGCTRRKSVDLSDNVPLGATSRRPNCPELIVDSTSRVPGSPDEKFVSVEDVPSSPVIFDEPNVDSTSRVSESSDGKFVSVKEVPSSPVVVDVIDSTSDSEHENLELVGHYNAPNGENLDLVGYSNSPQGENLELVDYPNSPEGENLELVDYANSPEGENLELKGYSNSPNGIIGQRDSDRVPEVNCEFTSHDFHQNLKTLQDESNSSSLEVEFFSKTLPPTNSECRNVVQIFSDSEDSDDIFSGNNKRKKLLQNSDGVVCGNDIRKKLSEKTDDILCGDNSRKKLSKDSDDILCRNNSKKELSRESDDILCGNNNNRKKLSKDSGDILGGNNSRKKLSKDTDDILCKKNRPDGKKVQSLETGDKVKCKNKQLGVTSDGTTKFKFSDSPITPLPDYKKMMTPEIKQALSRIGVKALPRKKAIALLSHVYDETHPVVNPETNLPLQQSSPQKSSSSPKKRKRLSGDQPSKKKQREDDDSSQEDSEDSGSENPEWSGCVPEISFSQYTQDSPTKASKDDLEAVRQYIRSNEDVYGQVLNYKPLNMLHFHHELKDSGIKISVQKLMDFLDEQCITFTCPRKEEFKKKQTARTQRFRKKMIAKLSQQQN